MTSTLDIAQIVPAVVSCFHNAADLTKQLSKKSKKRRGSETGIRLKILLESLEAGEIKISQKYSQHFEELGSVFKVGDGTSTLLTTFAIRDLY